MPSRFVAFLIHLDLLLVAVDQLQQRDRRVRDHPQLDLQDAQVFNFHLLAKVFIWLGYMPSKLCRRAVDDVAASKKFAVLAALEQLSLLLKRHVYFCCACFLIFAYVFQL